MPWKKFTIVRPHSVNVRASQLLLLLTFRYPAAALDSESEPTQRTRKENPRRTSGSPEGSAPKPRLRTALRSRNRYIDEVLREPGQGGDGDNYADLEDFLSEDEDDPEPSSEASDPRRDGDEPATTRKWGVRLAGRMLGNGDLRAGSEDENCDLPGKRYRVSARR